MSNWPLRKDTLCIDCQKACGGCNWSNELLPVEWWTVEENYDTDGIFYSYQVIECPEFQLDNCNRSRPPAGEMDVDGCHALIGKALKWAAKDYIVGNDKTREECEEFISNWVADSRAVMEELKKLAAEHDKNELERAQRIHMDI